MQGPIGVYLNLLLLRRGPRDLPASTPLLVAAAGASFGIEFAGLAHRTTAGLAFARAALDLALMAGAFSALLVLRGQSHRLRQTLSALLGVDALLSLPSAVAVLSASGKEHDELLAYLFLPILAWSVLVNAHIVRSALEVPMLNGVAIAMTFVVVVLLIQQAWPAVGAT